MASDNKRMKAFSKRLSEMRKTPSAAISKAEDDTAPKLSSVDTPKQKVKADLGNTSFAEAFRTARNSGDKTFTWKGKSFTTKLASEGASRPAANKPEVKTGVKPEVKPASAKINPPASLSTANKGKNVPTPADVRARAAANLDKSAAAKRSAEKSNFQDRLFNWLGRGSDADARSAAMYRSQNEREQKYKAAVAAREAQGYKKGGKVKKFKKAGPVMESDRKPIDIRRSVLGSDKDIIGRGNRTPYEPIPKTGPDKEKPKLGRAGKAGFKSGGKVQKKAMGGMASPMSTGFKPGGGPGGSRNRPVAKPTTPTPAPTATNQRLGGGLGIINTSGTATTNSYRMKDGGKVKKMAKGGSFRASANGIAKKGKTKAMMPKMAGGGKCYAKGGSVDGIAVRGKTRCKGVK